MLKRSNNKKKKIFAVIPIIISLLFLIKSPNIFKEIKQEKYIKNKKSIQKTLNTWYKKNSINNNKILKFNIKKKKASIFLCESFKDKIILVPIFVNIHTNSDKIKSLLNHLFNKVSDDQYKNLIPHGTILLNYEFNNNINVININLNNIFLNTISGYDTKKLKIAQLFYTLNSIYYIKKIYIKIHGKKVPFLDRDGIFINRFFNIEEFKKIIYYN